MLENPATAALGPYVALNNAFTPAEVDQIVALGDALVLNPAAIGREGVQNRNIRVTRTATFWRKPETEPVYRKMEMLAQRINEEVYRFDLTGFSEDFQYTVYEGHEGGHYDWHVDQGLLQVNRKLSFSLQLSDENAYQGCDLELFTSTEIQKAPRRRGTLIAFPAYALHRVTPVLSGTRKSLVIWTQGPRFR